MPHAQQSDRLLAVPAMAVLAIMVLADTHGTAVAAGPEASARPALALREPTARRPRVQADEYADWTGERIIAESVRRHEQYPDVYEEQTMILTDAAGHRTVRKLRRFSKVGADGGFHFLLVFDDPEAIRGVALLAERRPDSTVQQGVYLPAFGAQLKQPSAGSGGGNFLGTDFAVEDLASESTGENRYLRGSDQLLDDATFFSVDAYPRDARVERTHGYGLRRHLVRKDNFVIVGTDFFDRRLRLVKRLTRHDIRRVDGLSWRANMTMIVDVRDQHRTLLKVDRRVYSSDYVPPEIFEPAYLLGNRAPPLGPGSGAP